MMAKLIELPNGDWIEPDTVSAIKVSPPTGTLGWRCTVIASGMHISIELGDVTAAKAVAVAADVAKLVNRAPV